MPTPPTPQADPLTALTALPGVGSALAAAQAAVDVVLKGLPRRRVSAEQTRSALVATTLAGARLEDEPDRWASGCARLGGELTVLADQVRVAPGTVLARLHLLLGRDLLAEADLGRIRTGVDGDRLTGLMKLLTARTAAPAPVLGAIAHAEVALLEPFGPGSGIIARALEHLVLIEARIDPVGMIMVERGHAEAGPGYAAGLRAYASGTPLGATQWLRQCAEAIARGAELSPLAENPSGSGDPGDGAGT